MKFIKNKIFLFATVLFAIVLWVAFHTVEFVYVNPETETGGLLYIAKVSKKFDEALKYSIDSVNAEGGNLKYIYKNLYGSGFVKRNPIPNDLDTSAGIFIGSFTYDGKNQNELAEEILYKMDAYQSSFNYYIHSSPEKQIFIDKNYFDTLKMLNADHQGKAKDLGYGITKVFEDKQYIVHTTKTLENGVTMDFPFVLAPNEILIENYPPIVMLSEDVSYSPFMPKYLRELMFIPEFFIDLKDAKTGKVKRVEIVGESFMGQRLQIKRRIFVPSVFIGEESADYLKKMPHLNSDEDYLYFRLFNFKRYLQEFANLKELDDRPVKMMKRILQCTALIAPALDENTVDDIYKTVQKNLNNRDVQLLNEYENAEKTLFALYQNPAEFRKINKNPILIRRLYNTGLSSLEELKARGNVNKETLNRMSKYYEDNFNSFLNVKTDEDYASFYKIALLNAENIKNDILACFEEVISDKEKLISFINIFQDIYKKAGFHKLELYWLDHSTMGVLKNEYLKNISEKEFNKRVVEENKLVGGVKYRYITSAQIPKISVKYSYWAVLNRTAEEEQNWQVMKQKLLKDKKKFKIKRRFVLTF